MTEMLETEGIPLEMDLLVMAAMVDVMTTHGRGLSMMEAVNIAKIHVS